jgi:GNAT superfamily N-acetyltransferase
MSNTVREAVPKDVPSLTVIRQQAMEAGFTDEYPRSDFADLIAAPDDRLHEWIGSTDTLVLVAEMEITPIGFGVYEVSSARIPALYTAPEYQGEGCASSLLERFERRARNDGADRIQATVPLNAVGFFERRGFERERTTERDGIPMVVCTKPIS